MVRIRSEAEPESSADTCYTHSRPLSSLQIARIYTVHVYMCIYVLYVCMSSYICMYYVYAYTHIYIYVTYIYTPAVLVYAYIYIHTYTYLHIYIHTYCIHCACGVWCKSSLLSFKETRVVSVAHSSESQGGDQEVTTSRFLPIYDHVDQLSVRPIFKKKPTLLDYYSIHSLSYFSLVV